MKSNPKSNQFRIAIVAGEISGDNLASDLMKSIQSRLPNIEFEGIGGRGMIEQGLHSLYPMERLSVMGLGAIFKRLPELLRMRKVLIKHWTESNPPDLFIGIDAPEFNIGLELKLKQQQIKTLHYVSPSVWAWRPKRIFKIKKAVDHMLTLFPFENEIYQRHRIDVTCVGHYLATQIPLVSNMKQARVSLGLPLNKLILAILPGSRTSEVKLLTPLFFQAAKTLLKTLPDLIFVIPVANERCRNIIQSNIEMDDDLGFLDKIQLVEDKSHLSIEASDVVLLASGTVTLETALLKKPMVMAYKLSTFSYVLFNHLSQLKYYSLPNLLVNRELVPEFLQHEATVANLTTALLKQFDLSTQARQQLLEEYTSIHQQLILGGSEKGADVVCQLLDIDTEPASIEYITLKGDDK